jgi:uncharacterized protein (TIGR02147 family)
MKTIFEYLDYRAYLRDYYASEKERRKYFSYRLFARMADIKSPVFLKEVADGRKNLSRTMIEKFSAALKFNEKEAAYFKYLVLFDQATSAQEKQEHYTALRAMENIKSENALAADQYDYFSNWYNVVIRELVTLFDVKDDFELLARMVRPAIKASEAKRSVELLLGLGLIDKNGNGRYVQKNTAITAQGGIASLAIRNFNRNMISQALTAIDELPKTERNMFGITVGISPTMYDIICAEMAAFKDRIVTLVSRDHQSSRVYQMNLQLFPMSQDKAAKPANKEARP